MHTWTELLYMENGRLFSKIMPCIFPPAWWTIPITPHPRQQLALSGLSSGALCWCAVVFGRTHKYLPVV